MRKPTKAPATKGEAGGGRWAEKKVSAGPLPEASRPASAGTNGRAPQKARPRSAGAARATGPTQSVTAPSSVASAVAINAAAAAAAEESRQQSKLNARLQGMIDAANHQYRQADRSFSIASDVSGNEIYE